MENSDDVSESQLKRALYDACSENGDAKAKEDSSNFLNNLPPNNKLLLSLIAFISNANEDDVVREYASLYLFDMMGTNELVRPMTRILLNEMKIPETRYSMKKEFTIFVKIFILGIQKPNADYSKFIVNLMIKYLNENNDEELHEFGVIIFHAVINNLTSGMLPCANIIAQGVQIILKKTNQLIQQKPENSHILCFHTLMCAKKFGQYITKLWVVVQLYRNSVQDMLDLLKFIAANGNENDFNEVVELLEILLKYKKLSGKKWINVFATFKIICRKKKYPYFARIETLKILGNLITVRKMYFQEPKIFHGLLETVFGILCQKPIDKENQSLECETNKLPTPISVAADLLQFISIKFPPERVGEGIVQIILSIINYRTLNKWNSRGCFLSLAKIMEKCGSYLSLKYSKELTIILKGGFIDYSKYVRQAATYALYKLLARYYVECKNWVKETFSAFLLNMKFFINDYKNDSPYHPLHVEMLFDTLKIYCAMLKIDLLPHLSTMMRIFQSILKHIKNNRIITCTIEQIQETIFYVGSSFLPYYNSIMMKLEPFIINWDNSDYDEIRPIIVDLLTYIMRHEIGGNIIIELVFNMLQIQHARTQVQDASLEVLLKYSPLRYSIFQFIQEIFRNFNEDISKYVPKFIGTLIGTVTAIQFIRPDDLEYIEIRQRRPHFIENTLSTSKYFKITDNNETETEKCTMIFDSFTLNDEVLLSVIVLQTMIETCLPALKTYLKTIYVKLIQTFKYANDELCKQIIYTLNNMMDLFMKDFQFQDGNFIDLFITEIIDILDEDTDTAVFGESVYLLLCYIAIKEKHLKANFDTHFNLTNILTDIFDTIVALPQHDYVHRREKEILLNEVIGFMTKLSEMCSAKHFNNYFTIYLCIFEAKINMPLHRSTISDEKRLQAFQKLIDGFHLMEKDKTDNFERISNILIKGLNDPVVKARENCAAGLGKLVDHCDLQSVKKYKDIINVLWKTSNRETNKVVLDNIWYGMVLTIRRDIWKLPIRKLSLQLIQLLPIRDVFNYNMIMVDFFEYLCLERPKKISHIVRGIYKCLLELLEHDFETDVDPLYKRTVSLAASLYSMHIEELRQISISPTTMQAILSVCKNRAYLKAILR